MSERVELTVPAEAAGQRLDAWLARGLPSGSRARAQRLLDAGQVLVDGKPRPKRFRLAGGERLSIDPDLPEAPPEPVAVEPEIVFEDDHLLIVDKPAGIVVHPAPGHHFMTLVDLLADRAGGAWRPLVVHRLDKETSGLMVVAKDEPTQHGLRELIRRRELEREYLALLKGRLGAKSGTVDAPIGRDVHRRTRMSTRTSKPRMARTHFLVEQFLNGYTLVRVRLETGRTHQIRTHFAAKGSPVCGDREYGGGGELGLKRQFLHSARIAFAHPATGASLERSSPLPMDLKKALDSIR